MRGAIRFLAALLVGLALLTAGADAAVAGKTRNWFEADVAMRSQLAVASARGSLVRNWRERPERLAETLADITRDERIMSAAVCAADGELLAATPAYPAEFSCRVLQERARLESPEGASSWSMTPELPAGRLHLSVTQVEGHSGLLGSIVLVHDLSFLTRREATARNFVLLSFFVLSLAAALITLVAARLAWRSWTLELRRALTGDATLAFEPLLRDVRSLGNASGRPPRAPGAPRACALR